MHIKLLAEGSTQEDRKNENWGVSFLLGKDTLFDTFGKPGRFLDNLHTFNVDVSKIRNIVISHDDWDHVSGLWRFLELNNRTEVYLCRHTDKQIIAKVKAAGAKMIEPRGLLEIREGIYSTGEIKAESDGRIIYEQALIIKSSKGITLLTGCAHPGIVNLVESLIQQIGIHPYCVIGGFHLKNTHPDEAEKVVKRFKELGVRLVCPLHCTGEAAVKLMRDEFREGFVELKEGKNIEV